MEKVNALQGYTEIRDVTAVFISDNDEIVILGTPESTDDESGHNCDYMGCSSMEHVIYRGKMKDVRVGW